MPDWPLAPLHPVPTDRVALRAALLRYVVILMASYRMSYGSLTSMVSSSSYYYYSTTHPRALAAPYRAIAAALASRLLTPSPCPLTYVPHR